MSAATFEEEFRAWYTRLYGVGAWRDMEYGIAFAAARWADERARERCAGSIEKTRSIEAQLALVGDTPIEFARHSYTDSVLGNIAAQIRAGEE